MIGPLRFALHGLIALFAMSNLFAQTTETAYTLVWADEFNNDGPPDPGNWSHEAGFVRNNELQWYQPDNATCAGGLLIIEGRRERRPNPNYQAGSTDWKLNRAEIQYTASSLHTRGKQSWRYGRFEMRARIPAAAGLWPAFWTLGVSGEWPSCGEIDIMEYYREMILANAAWGSGTRYNAVWDSATKRLSDFDADWRNRFHVWRMDWSETTIRLSVDGLVLNTIDVTRTRNANLPWGPANPMQQPHYLLLNLAIGGTNGGNPAATPFPARYEIDYVRVYRAEQVAVVPEQTRLLNMSVRALVRGREQLVILGFVVGGTSPKKLLMRGIGPQLASFGVSNVLADPLLTIYRAESNSQSTLLFSNDDWAQEGATALSAAFTAAGAFALPQPSSRDAAFLGVFSPGAYTLVVSGEGGSSGEALAEIYEMPATKP
jgi:beta-glucanase (GH16 family)